MRICTSEPASPHVDIARGKREKVAGDKSRYLFVLRSPALAGYIPAWRAAFSRLELTQELTMVISSTSVLFLHWGWLSKGTPASVAMSIRKGLDVPRYRRVLSRKGLVSSAIN